MTAVTGDLLADQDFPSQTISGHHNDLQWLAVCGHHRTVQGRGGECTRVQCTGPTVHREGQHFISFYDYEHLKFQ